LYLTFYFLLNLIRKGKAGEQTPLRIKKPRNKGGIPDGDTTSKVSKEIIAKLLEKVKGKVSQVRDANVEPLPVFHGTPNESGRYRTRWKAFFVKLIIAGTRRCKRRCAGIRLG
jgi:hypothetical protein